MYANVIPLTRLPLHKPQVYTYEPGDFSEQIKAGQVVEISLYHRDIPGIVKEAVAKAPANIKFKKINKIIDVYPLLNAHDLQLTEFISDYYFSSLGLVLKQLLPEPPKRKIKKLANEMVKINLSIINTPSMSFRRKQESREKKAEMTIKNLDDNTEVIIDTPTQRQQKYLEIIKQALKNKQQTLFLVPELILIPQTLAWLKKNFPAREVVLLHSEMSKTQALINWRKAQTGSAFIFLGTRRAVLTSFYNLGNIIIDEEQDLSYKQWDMNPRYDARRVLEKKAEIYGCNLTFGASSPSVATYYKYSDLNIPPFASKGLARFVVDMRDELKRGNYTIFSENLQHALIKTITEKKQAILFVNRRGSSTFVMCRDCGHIIRCPKCKVPLMEHSAKTLSCNHCNFKANSPASCPNCNSHKIKGFGIGVEKVEQEVKALFPDNTVSRLDSGMASRLKNAKKKYQEFSDNMIDILVGTQSVLHLTSSNLHLIAAINIDSVFNFPDWRADEKSWHILNKITNREDARSIIIQTYNPENKLLQILQQNKPEEFYQQELANRKMFKYPPYIKMIKLICRSDDYDYLHGEANRVATTLRNNIAHQNVIGPNNPINPKIRNFWQKQIVLKLDKNKMQPEVKKILQELNSSWSIDVDPQT